MKLLNKISIRYLIFSLLIMIITGGVLFTVLSHVIRNQLEEKLENQLASIKSELRLNGYNSTIWPNAEVAKVEKSEEYTGFYDTSGLTGEEEENGFRVLDTVFSIDGVFYRVHIRESRMESDDLFENLILILLVSFILLTISLFALVRRISLSIWNPFYANLEEVKKFSLKKTSPVVLKTTGINEFDELNQVIISLTNRIIEDYRSLKTFSEDASHEIQTPLSVIISRLEGVMNTEGLKQEVEEGISSAYSSAIKLSKIQKSLILITRIENLQFNDISEVSFSKLIDAKINEMNDLVNMKKIDLKFIKDNDIVFSISNVEAEILINNLFSNSLNHNISGGVINIGIDKNRISFCNSSANKAGLSDHIFNRFGKGTSTSDSAGLGLAIVKRICENYNINVLYEFSNLNHCFHIEFPL